MCNAHIYTSSGFQGAKHFLPQTHGRFPRQTIRHSLLPSRSRHRYCLFVSPVQVQIVRVIPELLDSCGIFHSNNRKAQNSSLEVRNPEMRLIKYICLICSPLHLTSHGSCDPKDNFFKNRSKMADELNI